MLTMQPVTEYEERAEPLVKVSCASSADSKVGSGGSDSGSNSALSKIRTVLES